MLERLKSFFFQIFCKIKEKDPDALEKIVVVPGDIAQENLGMTKDDLQKVTEQVSVVFHCAAAVTFFKPLRQKASFTCCF